MTSCQCPELDRARYETLQSANLRIHTLMAKAAITCRGADSDRNPVAAVACCDATAYQQSETTSEITEELCHQPTRAPALPETLVGMVEQHAQRRPDGIAIRFGERQWSWAQWASRIRQAAGALRAAGLQRGQCVAFLDKNHPACLETLLAAASMGAVATIVNWRVIGDELVHVLNDSGARVLFVGAELLCRGRGDPPESPGPGPHHRGGRRRRRVRIPARSGVARRRRPRGHRQRHCPDDLQLGHHRAPERRPADPARAGQPHCEPVPALSLRRRRRELGGHAAFPRGWNRIRILRHPGGRADLLDPRTRSRNADRRRESRCDACLFRSPGDRPVPGRRGGGAPPPSPVCATWCTERRPCRCPCCSERWRPGRT